MNNTLSKATHFGYKKLVKPVLFKRQPDAVHDGMVRTGSWLQRIAPARGLLRAVWAYESKDLLAQTVAGVKYDNPIGLSAGLDKNIELPPLMKAVGFGFMICGSVTYEPCAGNPRPWFYRLPRSQSLVVNAGLGNQGIAKIKQRILGYKPAVFKDFPLSVSVAKTNSPEAVSDEAAIEDYLGTLKVIKENNLSPVVEINISCPNTYGGEPFTTPARLEKLLARIDELELGRPVYVKMPQNLDWAEFSALLDVILRHDIAGVTVANLAKNRSAIKLDDPLPDSVPGNLSGKPTRLRSNMLIRKTYEYCGDRLVIIGVGGVFSAEDAYEKIRLGASLVALITGLIFEGPQLVGRINRELTELLKRDGFSNVSEAVGVDASSDS